MGKLEKYSSYKDSGVEWLGEIPEHWELKPIKYLKKNIKNAFVDGPFGSSLKTEHFVQDGDVYVVESGFITTGKFKYKDFKTITDKHFKTIQRSSCTQNDVIIAKIGANYGMAGELPKLDKKSVVSGNSLKITLDDRVILNSIFVKLLESVKRLGGYNGIVNISAQPALSLGTLNNLRLPLPPKNEQTKIASFLDEKTAQIDEVISQKEKLIELLKERKQIVINDAVTKGLNKNVEFVDSSVEWIGQIPKHWEIEKVKYIFKDSAIKNYGEEIPLAATQLYGVVPKDTLDYRTVEANVSDLNTFKLVKENNFVISLRSFEGGIEYSAYKGIISPAYTVMEALQDIAFKYFKYLFKSNIFIQALNIYKTGIREGQNISFSKFKDDFLPLPPKNEQIEIAEYIETQTTKIDKAIELQQNYISKLKEYKASLIDSVVTGKVRVL